MRNPWPGRTSAAEEALPELSSLQRLIDQHADRLSVQVHCQVGAAGRLLPVYSLSLGATAPDVPALGFFAGVHGLERIGTLVVLSFLRSLLQRLAWDETLQWQLQRLRLVFMPLVNPAGMLMRTRCNTAGVDLMRNAPLDASSRALPLAGGHRISPRLPWYRGRAGERMQPESLALCEVAEQQLMRHTFSIALDCHSGFGMRDRLWLPYAHTPDPMPQLSELHALLSLFGESHPHHDYLIEPQSRRYLAHGDLWDHLHLRSLEQGTHTFLPLTLEMGSWRWARKNPLQLFSRLGLFNPLRDHRRRRALRRHHAWMDFLLRATLTHRRWLPSGAAREQHRQLALRRWYGRRTA